MRRMDRYKDENTNERLSRSNKNKELYQNVGTNTRYTNLTDVTNANAIDITNTTKEYKTREDYHKLKKYNNDVPTPKVKKDLEDFNNLYNKHENRVYDINNVLEEARKNRQEDDLEEKRKLKNTSYNILANLNKEELEKYRQEKKDRLTKDEDELRELLDTIASKTLAGELEIASDLLSDLMATSILDKVDKPIPDKKDEISSSQPVQVVIEKEEIIMTPEEYALKESKENLEDLEDFSEEDLSEENTLNKNDLEELKQLQEKLAEQSDLNTEEEPKKEELTGKDQDFYTRSMDLSASDFDLDEEFKDKKIPLIVKILIIIIIIVAIVVAIYFLKQRF